MIEIIETMRTAWNMKRKLNTKNENKSKHTQTHTHTSDIEATQKGKQWKYWVCFSFCFVFFFHEIQWLALKTNRTKYHDWYLIHLTPTRFAYSFYVKWTIERKLLYFRKVYERNFMSFIYIKKGKKIAERAGRTTRTNDTEKIKRKKRITAAASKWKLLKSDLLESEQINA